jgi:integrase
MRKRFAADVLPVIGTVKISDLHRRDINRVLDPIVARESLTQARLVFTDMRGMLNWAVKRGDIDANPMTGMSSPSQMVPRERVLSDDEIESLWSTLPTSLAKSKTCQRIIRLCLVTGQRVGEIAGMRRDELDMKARTWRLPGSRTKNAHPHVVPLSDLAISIIEEALADAGESPFIFPNLTAHAIARMIGRAQEVSKERPQGRFGIAHWSAHDLRRTSLTGMAKLGVAPIVIAHVANHQSVAKAGVTFAHYVRHGYEREMREALELWADRLKAIIGGESAAIVPMMKRA